ncbi:nucleotide pyrophosphohydrolase [Lachnoclostridium phytofermentans]|uniref:nucleotide pyrophosphohydrolase n=1 Tax=Lachnoclostridium phytofermentans TaxID=66219 RepID=UPI000495C996|nr:nucleotide pyrophosphohydrolase [Lachnoclostridium phytofermentans]
MESNVSIKVLKDKVQSFCEERDWDQFHNPKDLAIGISTEANELLDLFRFKSEEDMMNMLNDSVKRCSIEEELADTFFFILRFAQRNNMDLAEILYEKMKKNALKYPVEKAKGSNLKYTEYER